MQESLKELKNVKSLTAIAFLMAITIVLGYFTIQIGDFLKIGLSAIPAEMVSILFGPAVGAIFGGSADIIKYIVHPTGAFFPGFTISGIISGFIYGIFLYKKTVKLTRIFLANFTVAVVVNMIINTFWLTLLYGTSFLMIFPARALKEIIMCIINTVIMFILYNALKKVLVHFAS